MMMIRRAVAVSGDGAEKVIVQCQRALKIKCADIEHRIDGYITVTRVEYFRGAVDRLSITHKFLIDVSELEIYLASDSTA